jgi:NDP-mannose synthase
MRGSQPGSDARNVRAVILAGGRGTRLAPYTSILPKPLMPVGDRAILELVVEQLAAQGVRDITLSVGYLSHLIRAVLGNGDRSDVDLNYVHEAEPLGTAGPLRLVHGLEHTFVALNGDVLTNLSYAALLAYHRSASNVMTIATTVRTIGLDYGVLHIDGGGSSRLVRFDEKPQIHSAVSMGIYALEPRALDYLPTTGPFDIPDLVKALLADGQPIGAFVHEGLWFDIGRKEDYEEAISTWATRDLDFVSILQDGLPRQAPSNARRPDGLGVTMNGG